MMQKLFCIKSTFSKIEAKLFEPKVFLEIKSLKNQVSHPRITAINISWYV